MPAAAVQARLCELGGCCGPEGLRPGEELATELQGQESRLRQRALVALQRPKKEYTEQ